MPDFVYVTFFLWVASLVTIYFAHLPLPCLRIPTHHTPSMSGIKRFVYVRTIFIALCIYTLILISSIWFLKYYLYLVFTILYTVSCIWIIMIHRSLFGKWLIFTGVLLYYLSWILGSYHELQHNLLLIWSLAWIGSAFVKIGILNVRGFIRIALIWCAIDIVLVWLTSTGTQLMTHFESIRFPLWISWGSSGIGTGDLLFLSMFLPLLKIRKLQLYAAALCLTICLGVFIYAHLFHIVIAIPLLVLWSPVSLLFLLSDKSPIPHHPKLAIDSPAQTDGELSIE